MKVVVERRKYDALVIAIQDAIDSDDDKSSLCENVVDCFTDEQSEEIEDSLGEELFDYISEIIDDWDSDDGETLWELVVQKLSDEGIVVVVSESPESDSEEDDEEEEEDDDDDDDDEEDLDEEDEDSDDD
jgi:ribonuclease E